MKRIISIILSLTTLFSVNGVCFGAESAEPSALAAAKLSAVTAAAIDGADELLWPHIAEESDETEDAAAQESHRLAEEQAAQHAPSEAELYGEAESGAELFSAQQHNRNRQLYPLAADTGEAADGIQLFDERVSQYGLCGGGGNFGLRYGLWLSRQPKIYHERL